MKEKQSANNAKLHLNQNKQEREIKDSSSFLQAVGEFDYFGCQL